MTAKAHANTRRNDGGFTIVEVIGAIVLVAIFSIMITQLYIMQSQISGSWLQFEKAEQIAYNNLETYARYVAEQTTVCTDYPTTTTEKQQMVSTVPVGGLPSPVTQTVTSSMPYGCSVAQLGEGIPIKVVSTVTYGPNAKKTTYGTYVNAKG